jgi:DNA repair exonuclease SbcCD ATPase subunit
MRDAEGNHVSLRDYIDRIFEEKQKAVELGFKSQQDALSLASRTLEQRLEKLNELRQEVTSDRGRYVTREKYDADIEALNIRVGANDRETRQRWGQIDGALSVVRYFGIGGLIALAVEVLRLLGVVK